jgi:sodium-dependent phosphate cotransporter
MVSRGLAGAPLSGSTNSLVQGSDSAKAADEVANISTGVGLPPKGLQSSLKAGSSSHHIIKPPADSTKGPSGGARRAGPGRGIILSSDSYKGISHSARGGSTRSRIGKVYKKKGDKIVIVGSDHHHVPAPCSDGFELEPEEEATWSEVFHACCYHTGSEWMKISFFFFSLLLVLYFFLVGLDLLGTSFAVVGGCTAGSLLGSDTSPLASVMIGVIATALLQSSSTTTAIIVSLVSGGLDVNQAIYMVMGANVGTTITAMLVSLAHISEPDELERAFAGSSMYFIFNFLTIIILFPLEVGTGYLYKLTKAMLPSSVGEGDSWEGPIKQIVGPLVKTFIIANKDLIEETANHEGACEDRYPIQCSGSVNYDNCQENAGAIGCNEKTGSCPVFFQVGASKKDDMVSGWVCLVIAVFILIMCLVGLVSLLRKVLLGASTRILYKATNINDFIAIAIGCGVTILVQSSSITTSTLVPLAGVGVLRLEKMYPLELGADIGTTFTALMAAMVSSKIESLQIALVHLFFNLTGIIIWYRTYFLSRDCQHSDVQYAYTFCVI